MLPCEFLQSRTLWKVCEAVHLNLSTVYLSCPVNDRVRAAMHLAVDGVRVFCGSPCPVQQASDGVFRFTISADFERLVRYSVLPALPSDWWRIHPVPEAA